jgi:succinate dehydrogenase/fumarate reductase-like Fe-S protein
MMQTRLRIFRFNPESDPAPSYRVYEVPWTEGLTLLAALRMIYGRIDRTLGFRNYFCGRGLCTGCRVTVDGTVKKACHVLLEAGREYLVEPIKNYPIIRDLVVDFGIHRSDPDTGKEFFVRQGTLL